jgi:flagellar hook-associated protein 3 FlgL
MISYLMRASETEAETQRQIATGKKVNTFSDISGDIGVLMSAKRAEANMDQYTRTAREVASRLGLQDIQMREMEDITLDMRMLVTQTIASGSGFNFQQELDGLFNRFVSLLNSSVDGKYMYSGTRTDTPPVNVNTLAQMVALPSVDDAFDNNNVKRSINIDDNERVDFGFVASDMARDIFQSFKDLSGVSTSTPLTQPEADVLSDELNKTNGLIENAMTMTSFVALNGRVARQVESAIDRHEETQIFVKTFISSIEDVDLAEAVSRLTMNQLQTQATARVVAQLTRISLLDYL